MSNEQNLIPFSERTESEQREIRSMGGKASGASRRRKKSLKEAADLYFSLPVKDKRRLNAMLRAGVSEEDADNQMAMIIGLTKQATEGDARAAKVLFDLFRDDQVTDSGNSNNLLDAIKDVGEIDTDDLPEVE